MKKYYFILLSYFCLQYTNAQKCIISAVANNQITITVDKQKTESIMVYDMQGKLMIQQTPNAINMYHLPIANLSEGIYSVVVKTNKTVYSQKISVLHP